MRRERILRGKRIGLVEVLSLRSSRGEFFISVKGVAMSVVAGEVVSAGESVKPSEGTEIAIDGIDRLLQMAIEKNMDHERIGQFLDLHDRMQKTRAQVAYATAMNKCQSEMPIVVKEKKNELTGSYYARLEEVANTIKPVYLKHGFSLEFGESDASLKEHRRITCQVTHIGGLTKLFYLESPIDNKGPKGNDNKTAIQGLGSLVTYIRRYLTCMIFNVTVADEDNDGNDTSAYWTEEQCKIVRDKMRDCEEMKIPVSEGRFIAYLSKGQKGEEAKVYEDLQQSAFPRAIAELDRVMREKRNRSQEQKGGQQSRGDAK